LENPAALHAVVTGHVQGVYFRAFVAEKANLLGVPGFVCNMTGSEAVEVQAEGEKAQLEVLIKYLKKGPPHSRVDKVAVEWSTYSGKYTDFVIRYQAI
jgi:acylphosphatase